QVAPRCNSCHLRPDRARSHRACSQISEGQSVETLDQIFFDLLEDARDAVIVADRRSGGIRFWNPAARALLGYASAEAVSPAPDQLLAGILDVAGDATGAVELAVFAAEGREV